MKASLLPGVEDTRRPARVSTFLAESAPSPQKSPTIPISEFFEAESADRLIFFNQVSSLIIYRVKRVCATGGGVNENQVYLAHTPIFSIRSQRYLFIYISGQ